MQVNAIKNANSCTVIIGTGMLYCGSVDPTRTLVARARAREAGYVSRSQVPLGSGCAWPPTHASITHDVDARSGAACRALPFKRTAPPWAPRPQLLLAENWLHSLHMPALTAASRARQLNNPAHLNAAVAAAAAVSSCTNSAQSQPCWRQHRFLSLPQIAPRRAQALWTLSSWR